MTTHLIPATPDQMARAAKFTEQWIWEADDPLVAISAATCMIANLLEHEISSDQRAGILLAITKTLLQACDPG